MDNGMVDFPGGLGWEDSGEGGLFVMLVVVRPTTEEGHDDRRAWDTFCHVDVEITLPSPDVCVSAERARLWEPYDYKTCGSARMSEAAKILNEEGRSDLTQWALGTRSHLDESVELLAAMHLGSTGASLWSPRRGDYFEAGYDDLNERGRAVYDAFKAAYPGSEPMILTFLDT